MLDEEGRSEICGEYLCGQNIDPIRICCTHALEAKEACDSIWLSPIQGACVVCQQEGRQQPAEMREGSLSWTTDTNTKAPTNWRYLHPFSTSHDPPWTESASSSRCSEFRLPTKPRLLAARSGTTSTPPIIRPMIVRQLKAGFAKPWHAGEVLEEKVPKGQFLSYCKFFRWWE